GSREWGRPSTACAGGNWRGKKGGRSSFAPGTATGGWTATSKSFTCRSTARCSCSPQSRSNEELHRRPLLGLHRLGGGWGTGSARVDRSHRANRGPSSARLAVCQLRGKRDALG